MPLPPQLPRDVQFHQPAETVACSQCGAAMKRLGEDVSEQLGYVPARFNVIRHVRPKYALYALNRWEAMVCSCDGGTIEIDNSAAERALRGVALGRKNYLFVGADSGGERAAALYRLIETAKLNGMDPERYLRQVLACIADNPINRIDELLSCNITPPPMLQEAA